MFYETFPRAKLAEFCSTVAPQPDHAGLLSCLNAKADEHPFHHALTRGGWFRVGGVVSENGDRIAPNLRKWAESETDGDMFALYQAHADRGLLTTRFDGKMHYFVAPSGERSRDFVQLEVEELVEVIDRPLFVNDHLPDDVEELLDPPGAYEARLEPMVLSPPRYVFHGLNDIARLVDDHERVGSSDRRYIRLLEEWDESSAGAQVRFCDHFVLRLLPFLDRFGEHKIEALPLPVQKLTEPPTEALTLSGAPLANYLQQYSRAAGFPLAWYFHMLLQKKSMVTLTQAAYVDYQRSYRYLADRDIAILERWIRNPYSF